MQTATHSITSQYEALKQTHPHLRFRDAAHHMGISEAELLLELKLAKPLTITPKKLLEALPSFGRIMSLTRNEGCVLEHSGTVDEVSVMNAHVATVLGFIETRAFLGAWKHILLVEMPKGNALLKGLQVFDKYGDAVTKFFLKSEAEPEAYITWKFEAICSEQPLFEKRPHIAETVSLRSDFPLADFLKAWSTMADPHDFFGMLKKFDLTRAQAMSATLGVYTYPFHHHKLPELLSHLAQLQISVMIFAGNSGNVQIHQSEISKIVPMHRDNGVYWLNILDPNFNMHLRMDLIEKAYLVNKPSESGPVLSIECYDAQGELIVQFFGIRKPGISQDAAWVKAVQMSIQN